MPYYPMKCTFAGCKREFDWFTKPDLYTRSQSDDFRDVRCISCGSIGSCKRAWPPDSVPANLTVKGTWGRQATPGLKGREYYTVQERDRQLAEVGSTHVDDGETKSSLKPLTTSTYKVGKNGKVIKIDSRKPSILIREYANNNDGIVDFDGLREATGIEDKRLRGGIMGAIRQGWLEKTGARAYRLL